MLIYQNENIGHSFEYRYGLHNDGFSVPLHIHEYSELLYVIEGRMKLAIDGKSMCAEAGQMAFVFPNQSHEYTKEFECKCFCAVFSNDFLQPFFGIYPDMIPKNPIIDMGEDTCIAEKLMRADPCEKVLLTGLLHLLFDRLAKSTELEKKNTSGDSLYNAAINYISANFRSDFSLSDMAKALGYNEKYLSGELHSLTKMNFRMLLSTYRLEWAKRLLRTTASNVSEIALDSGFLSINSFNRTFKKLNGVTPTEYRKMNMK